MSVTEIVHQVQALNSTEFFELMRQLEEIRADELEQLADTSEAELIAERRLEPKRPIADLLA